MSPPTWTMPHPPDVQPDLPDLPRSNADGQPFAQQPDEQPEDQLLDASSLSTVLDMLAVIDCTEDLALLELLTPLQKRQVWDATPEAIRLRLKQIRLAKTSGHKVLESRVQEVSISESPVLDSPVPEMSKLPNTLQESALPSSMPISSIQAGDRVILLAKSQLTATEMSLIWEVVKVEAEQVYVKASGMSDRPYPLAWIVRYPN